jgi:hypothetical protein
MIELVHILRAMVEAACGGGKEEDLRRCNVPSINFSQLEQLVFDELWEKRRVAIYSTALEMEEDLEKLAYLGVLKYESGEVRIEDPGEFLRKIEPFMLVSRNMVLGNAYLKHVIQLVEDGARRYALENIAPQPAASSSTR